MLRSSTLLSISFCRFYRNNNIFNDSNRQIFKSTIASVNFLEPNSSSIAFRDEQTKSDDSSIALIRQNHAYAVVNGIQNHDFAITGILPAYILFGHFTDARNLFFQLDLSHCTPWNWMIRAFTMIRRFDFALLFYFKMLGHGVLPDKYTFPYVLKACRGGLCGLNPLFSIHSSIRSLGLESDMFIGSSLIKFYVEKGFINDARSLFNKMPEKDCVLYNTMINAYVTLLDISSSLLLFTEMIMAGIRPSSVTYLCLLSLSSSTGMIHLGTQVHGNVTKHGCGGDSHVSNSLLSMYSNCHSLPDSVRFFGTMPKSLVSWNTLISGYVKSCCFSDVGHLLVGMISCGAKPDSITFSTILPSMADEGRQKQVKEMHCYIIRNGILLDLFLLTALIDTYFKCGDVKLARETFEMSSVVDIVVCTAMISGLVINSKNTDALGMFRWLIWCKMKPNSATVVAVLAACTGLGAIKLGEELHGHIVRNGYFGSCFVGSAVIDMYAKCERLDLSYAYFTKMGEKDEVCWNSMITSCTQGGGAEAAIHIFREMGKAGMIYDSVTISSILSACAQLSSINHGKEIHGFVLRTMKINDALSATSLIDMYSKCGYLDSARSTFETADRNRMSWNGIISAYANHGFLDESMALLKGMVREGIRPDDVTFLCLLSGCSHGGSVDQAVHLFHIMKEEYMISARMEHYSCLADMLARAGRLGEAFGIIRDMPFGPDVGAWVSFLAACGVHGDAGCGLRNISAVESDSCGYYVNLSNLNACVGEWEKVEAIRSSMREKGVQKVVGYSSIHVDRVIHVFYVADRRYCSNVELCCVLMNLHCEMARYDIVTHLYL